ncbi:MAG: hypothetical protein CME36_09455 [unclassified Hahellaceae]|nr:hypothetical protein [Hahellaceae bacterium]|tara:strand:- start:4796 stop:5368 length:573 start_codon:yes stop_codon:yes gene_type:complete
MSMNAIVSKNAQLTMSSREIAELTGKRHDHVLVDIRKMLAELELAHPSFRGSYTDTTGRARPVFNLPKDLTITLVSGYNVKMRYAITKRWMELEERVEAPEQLPNSFAEALRLAADLEEQKQLLVLANTELTHERDGLSSVVGKFDHSLTRYARTLPGVNTQRIKRDLKEAGYLAISATTAASSCPFGVR